MRPQPSILHADLDAFYASVEQLLDPSLRGLPIAVGGGVVLAASYEAKAFGVRAGMAGWQARQRCPALRFVGGHFREYQRLGDEVMEVLRSFTPLVERISIDEAFLDVHGSIHLFGPPERIAVDLRGRVRDEIGLAISVGAATTKHLAKVASQVAKPDGVVVVEPGREEAFLGPLPVDLLWGVGPVTSERLASAGIRTVGELAAESPAMLERLLGGVIGRKLGSLAANRDERRVDTGRRASSVGAQSALGRRTATPDLLRVTFGYLCDRVMSRLRAKQRAGRTVTVRVRFPGMRSVTRSATAALPIVTTGGLVDTCVALAEVALTEAGAGREITLLAVSVSNLVPQPPVQLALPFDHDADHEHRRRALDLAVDRVRTRFGREAIAGAAVRLTSADRVPEEFRELAEGDPSAPAPPT